MVKIRLARAGAKKRPFYHLVAADSRSPRDGRFIERLGFYNPIAVGGEVRLRISTNRVDHWVARGAQLTQRAAKLVGEARAQPDSVPEAAPEAVPEDATPAAGADSAEAEPKPEAPSAGGAAPDAAAGEAPGGEETGERDASPAPSGEASGKE